MATLNDITYYFFGGPVEVAYGTNEGAVTEQGIDIARPAGAAVNAVHAGTVVWSNGYQVIVQLASGLYESYTHIVSTLQPGQSVAAGQRVGTISGQTGWPLYINGSPYYSSGPHVEFGVYNSLANAISFRSGINPAVDLSAAYAARGTKSASSTSPICNLPLIGGPLCNAAGAVGSAINGATGTVTGVPGDIGSAIHNAINGALSGITNGIPALGQFALGWIGKAFGKWLVLIGIGLAILIVFAAMLRGEEEQTLREAAGG